MFDWLRKEVQCAGSVLFRGSMPPRKERLKALAAQGIESAARDPAPNWHWAVDLKHPQWGEAFVACFRDLGPPPRVPIDYDCNLTPEERAEIASAGSVVSLSMKSRRKHVLCDRKMRLRFLHAIMGEHGLAAMDHVAQRFWSRAVLEDELAHDADLDIHGIYTIHAVTEDDGEKEDGGEKPEHAGQEAGSRGEPPDDDEEPRVE